MRRSLQLGLLALLLLTAVTPTYARRGRNRRVARTVPVPAQIQVAPAAVAPRLADVPAEQPPSHTELENAALAIHEVRAKRGSVLDGTFLGDENRLPTDEPGDDAFRDAVLNAVGLQIGTAMPAQSILVVDDDVADESGIPEFPMRAKWVQLLRDEARQLDAQAEELEDASRYEDADQLRAAADGLRQQARQAAALPRLPCGRCSGQ